MAWQAQIDELFAQFSCDVPAFFRFLDSLGRALSAQGDELPVDEAFARTRCFFTHSGGEVVAWGDSSDGGDISVVKAQFDQGIEHVWSTKRAVRIVGFFFGICLANMMQ